MAAVNAYYVSFTAQSSASPMLLISNFTTFPSNFSSFATVKRRVFLDSLSAINKSSVCETVESTGTQLYSFSLLPLLVLAALPGGFIGLTILTVQTILPASFEGNPGLRIVHGILGSWIMTLFLVHADLGLQLGLS